MAEKNYAEVIIGGKVITIGGKQDEEYLRKVASYLNGKIEALQKKGACKRLDPDTRAILTELNVCDDYFDTLDRLEDANRHVAELQEQVYELKHELAATQMKKENIEKELSKAQERLRKAGY